MGRSRQGQAPVRRSKSAWLICGQRPTSIETRPTATFRVSPQRALRLSWRRACGRPNVRYEITGAGWVHIRDWVAQWPPALALREPIPAKARLARLDELPSIIDMSRALAVRCTEESDKAHGKLTSRERLRAKAQPRDADEEYDAAMSVVQLEDEVLTWSDFAARWLKFANNVEREYVRFSKGAQDADEGG